ncbi:MAG: copper chaperone PCu(A)C [Phenylobacterium sp.]
MKTLLFALSLAFAATAQAPAHSAGAARTGVVVLQPWSRPAVKGTNAIGYMVLANHGRAADALERVESPIADHVEIHSSSISGGIMTMRPETQVEAPAGGQVIFGPGAYHLMFIGLTRALKAGDRLPATLTFAGGARIHVRFAVTSGAAPTASGVAH